MLGIPFIDRWLKDTFTAKHFDDAVDRLNYVTTATILTFFSIMVSCKQYVGSAIQCWMPMEFKGGWEQYAEDYCFIQNTFFVPEKNEIPGAVEDRQSAEIGYYQWVPIVLAGQAFMFYLPAWIWGSLYKQVGLDLPSVIDEASSLRAKDSDTRKREVGKLVDYIEDILATRETSEYGRFYCLRFGSEMGSKTTLFYIMIKFFYLINVIGQFVILNQFLGNENYLWGYHTFVDLYNGREWGESGVFPRVTLCDFSVRKLANVHRYTVQCVLMINMFNEKIYLFLWFWFFVVLVVTLYSTLFNVYRLFLARSRVNYIKNLLRGPHHKFNDDASVLPIRKFTNYALKPDGVLLMRFVEDHAGALIAKEICESLFQNYLRSNPYIHAQLPTHTPSKTAKLALQDMDIENGSRTKDEDRHLLASVMKQD